MTNLNNLSQEFKNKENMNELVQNQYHAKAFVSCSLRQKDKPFIDFICNILETHHIKPFGTVGKFHASPENPIESMKKNIEDADIVVICATPRYIQQDIAKKDKTKGLSEMIHIELGMAVANKKPIVAFVEKGTNVGNALPHITQYIELTGKEDDYNEKKSIITSLLYNAYQSFLEKVKKSKTDKRNKENTDFFELIIFLIVGYLVGYLVGYYVTKLIKNNN